MSTGVKLVLRMLMKILVQVKILKILTMMQMKMLVEEEIKDEDFIFLDDKDAVGFPLTFIK